MRAGATSAPDRDRSPDPVEIVVDLAQFLLAACEREAAQPGQVASAVFLRRSCGFGQQAPGQRLGGGRVPPPGGDDALDHVPRGQRQLV